MRQADQNRRIDRLDWRPATEVGIDDDGVLDPVDGVLSVRFSPESFVERVDETRPTEIGPSQRTRQRMKGSLVRI